MSSRMDVHLEMTSCLVSQKDDQTTSQFSRHATGEMILVELSNPNKKFQKRQAAE